MRRPATRQAKPDPDVTHSRRSSSKRYETRHGWSDGCVHLLALGNEELILEMGLHSDAAGLIIRSVIIIIVAGHL